MPNDMLKTVDSIYEASFLPISIIIVGLGDNDFTYMQPLDPDDNYFIINSKGYKSKRDIIQFVPFENFKNELTINYAKELVDETLKEIPIQIEEYYKKCGKFYEYQGKNENISIKEIIGLKQENEDLKKILEKK